MLCTLFLLIFQLSKTRFVNVREFRGKVLVDIREYYNNSDGDLKPGKKGKLNPRKLEYSTAFTHGGELLYQLMFLFLCLVNSLCTVVGGGHICIGVYTCLPRGFQKVP